MIFDILRRQSPRLPTIRLGTGYGGWVIPANLIGPGSVCYCVGAGEDISFDTQLAERLGADVWVMDPTPRAIEHFSKLVRNVEAGIPFPVNNSQETFYEISAGNLSRMHYLPVGLWSTTESVKFFGPKNTEHVSHSILNLQQTDTWFEAEVRRLRDVMADLGHDHVDLLKLDIEGAECTVLDTIVEDGLDVRAICVEYDLAAQSPGGLASAETRGSIERLQRGGYTLIDVDDGFNVLFVRADIGDELAKPSRWTRWRS